MSVPYIYSPLVNFLVRKYMSLPEIFSKLFSTNSHKLFYKNNLYVLCFYLSSQHDLPSFCNIRLNFHVLFLESQHLLYRAISPNVYEPFSKFHFPENLPFRSTGYTGEGYLLTLSARNFRCVLYLFSEFSDHGIFSSYNRWL